VDFYWREVGEKKRDFRLQTAMNWLPEGTNDYKEINRSAKQVRRSLEPRPTGPRKRTPPLQFGSHSDNSPSLVVVSLVLSVVLAHHLFGLAAQPQDMHSCARPVRNVNHPAVVKLDVVGLNGILAIDGVAVDHEAVGNSVFVRRR
jgi:hypothetical protein